jgi:hypothetical protein
MARAYSQDLGDRMIDVAHGRARRPHERSRLPRLRAVSAGAGTQARRHRHHGQPVRPQGLPGTRAIEAAGARLLYLPPYSPDFNPIENAFAKLKALLAQGRRVQR